jgi:hypothetical protein
MVMLVNIASSIIATNQMNLMTTIYGEFNGDEFGVAMVSMDYNGDGYDDLIVMSKYWNATGVLGAYYPGKLYFYWGGPDGLGNTPGFVIEGQSHTQFAHWMCNAGDMNGDGIEDLAITYSTDLVQYGTYKSIAIFLGKSTPQSAPDYVCTIPYTHVIPTYLGDVNGDGKSDLAFMGWHLSHRYSYFTYVWTDLQSDPVLLLNSGVYTVPIYLGGVGDVNGDGFDDAYLASPYNLSTFWSELLFGNASMSLSDSLLLTQSFVDGFPLVSPLGDINSDGYADFIGYTVWPNHYIWFGSTVLDSIPDLTLSLNSSDHDMHSFGRADDGYAVHGDLNGDGYDDFVCSDPRANDYNGQAGLWLGGTNVNATVDLVFNPPIDWQWHNFGHAKAVGDFNGDGYDDLALSCPRWMDGGFHDTGRIYVFSGNAQLADTTVANDDPVAPPVSVEDWRINVYPNPCSRYETELKVDLLGSAYAKDGSYTYRIYNVRGQLLKQEAISITELRDGSFRVSLEHIPTGIYLITINNESQVLISKKVAIY